MTTILTNTLGTLTLDETTGVATLTMAMDGGVNKVNADFGLGLARRGSSTADRQGEQQAGRASHGRIRPPRAQGGHQSTLQ